MQLGHSRRMDDIDYLQRRELQERAAAKRATSPAARAAHQELAMIYSALIVAVRRQRRIPVRELAAA